MPCLFWWGRCMCLPAFRVGNLTLHRRKMKGWERALSFPEHQSYRSLLWIFVLWPFHPTSVSIIISPALFTLLFLWLRDTEDNVMGQSCWLGQAGTGSAWPGRTHVLFGQAAVPQGLSPWALPHWKLLWISTSCPLRALPNPVGTSYCWNFYHSFKCDPIESKPSKVPWEGEGWWIIRVSVWNESIVLMAELPQYLEFYLGFKLRRIWTFSSSGLKLLYLCCSSMPGLPKVRLRKHIMPF